MGGMMDRWKKLAEYYGTLGGFAPFLPKYLVFFWHVAFPVFILALFCSAWHRWVDPRHEEVERGQRLTASISRYIQQSYELQYRHENIEALLQKIVELQPGFPGTAFEKIVLTPDSQTTLRVLVINNNVYWRRNDPTVFERLDGSEVDMRGLLDSESFRTALGASKHLVAVGLASTFGPNESDADNETLSTRRARHLADLIANATDRHSHFIWSAALGGATFAAQTQLVANQQRPAVVVGIDAAPNYDVGGRLPSLIPYTEVPGTNLLRYSKAKSPVIQRY